GGGGGGGARPPPPPPDDVAVLLFTSGTTGPPKGVPLTHANLSFQVEAIRASGLLRSDDRMLLPLPLHHVYPLVLGTLMPLGMGLTIILPAAVTGPELVRALKEGDATIIIGVPRLYEALLKGIEGRIAGAPAPARLLLGLLLRLSGLLRRWFDWPAGRILLRPLHRALAPRLRALASGGAALDPDVARRLAALGWDIAIGYGLSETSPLLTLKLPNGRHLDSVGKPIAGVELRLVEPVRDDGQDTEGDDKGDASPSTGEGELLARGPGVFQGYLDLPDKTAEVLDEEGWFRTGDLGQFDQSGMLHIAGRVSSMIVTSGGKNVHPDDIEKQYAQHPLIAEVGVLAHDGGLGAVVVPDRSAVGDRRVTAATAMRAAMAEASAALPSYQRITRYVVSDTLLERTRLGKLRRHRLKARFDELLEGPGNGDGGQPLDVSDMEPADQQLLENDAAAAAWELLAGRFQDRTLTPGSSTRIELGIDSLDWLELSLEIARRTGVELREDDIAGIDTVRDLLEALAEASPGEGGARSPVEEPHAFLSEQQRRWLKPLSPAEQRMARVLGRLITGTLRRWARLEVVGLEHLEACPQVVITPNHVSLLDPFLVGSALPPERLQRTAWSGWTGIAFRNAAFRWGSRLARVVPVDPQRAMVSSLAFAAAMLREGHSLVWFPEGQRSPAGELMSFRPGIGMLLAGVDVPVVPAWIDGAYDALPRGSRWPRRTKITVRFGEPVTGELLAGEGEGNDARSRIVDALEKRVRALAPATEPGPDAR
ncbi:MAG: AMP-binding protein, partial [Chromatiales bacterium]|nr:AMP-binding protein [Chromatiales bacterium]